MEPFTINVNISLKEFTIINFQQLFKRPAIIIIYLFLTISIVNKIVNRDDFSDRATEVVFYSIYLLLIPALLIFNSKRVYNNSIAMLNGAIYTFSDEGFETATKGAEAKASWDHILYRKESAKYVFLFTSITNRHIIPKALLTAAQLSDIQQRTKKKLF